MAVDPIPTNRQDGTTIRAAHVNELAEGVNDLQVQIDELPPGGYSAYELALQDGYEGTLEEWLESLRGPMGPPLTPNGVVSTVGDLPASGSPGDVWIVEATGHGWAWDGSAWVDVGQVTLTDLDETGSAPSIGLAGSAIDRVEDGDLWFAAGGVVGGGTTGGVLWDVASVQVPIAGSLATAPNGPHVGTAINVVWDLDAHRARVQSQSFGPRPAINVEGIIRQHVNQTPFAFSAIPFGSLERTVSAGTGTRTLVPAWTFMAAPIWVADNQTVEFAPTDTNHGGASFTSTRAYVTINGGQIDAAGKSYPHEMTDYHADPLIAGNISIDRRIGMDIAGLRYGGDPFLGGADTLTDVLNSVGRDPLTGVVDPPGNEMVNEDIGLRIRNFHHGRPIGIQNHSTTHRPPQTSTLSAAGHTVRADATVVVIDTDAGSTLLTLTSTPTIAAHDGVALDGTILTLVHGGTRPVRLQGEEALAGSGLADTHTLVTGDVLDLIWSDGAWRTRSAERSWVEHRRLPNTTIGGIAPGAAPVTVTSATHSTQGGATHVDLRVASGASPEVLLRTYVGSETVPRGAFGSTGITLSDGTDGLNATFITRPSAGVLRVASLIGVPHTIQAQFAYTADDASDWGGSAPTTVAAALDRLAAHLGPVP